MIIYLNLCLDSKYISEHTETKYKTLLWLTANEIVP